jgi:uncharacterized protein (TIGR00645 family)
MLGRIEALLARLLLGSRWLMAPLCLGLVAALVVLVEFFRELVQAVVGFSTMHSAEVILVVLKLVVLKLVVLKLVDLVLVANLVLLIMGAAAEIFVPDEPTAGTVRRGPPRGADISALKLKVFGSISAIAAIEVLESFINIESVDKQNVLWEILILLTLVISGVLLAWMDRLGEGSKEAGRQG